MQGIPRLARRVPLVTIFVFALILLGVPGTVTADGPVGPGTLPGGVNVADNDPGAGEAVGERWGRAGGKDTTYAVISPGDFTSLTWGAVGTAAVGMAFDGAIDGAGETLTLDETGAEGSNFATGVAVWTGQTDVQLANPASTIPQHSGRAHAREHV